MSKLEAIEGLHCPRCSSENMVLTKDKAQSGRKRYRCRDCGSRTTQPSKVKPQILPKFEKVKAERYIVTSAQNDTPINKKQLKTYERIAKETGSRLLILPTKYVNQDKKRQGFLDTITWPVETLPHLCNEEFKINKNLNLRGDTYVSVTAINPLQGVNHSSHTMSEIFGHAQLAMEMVPTAKDDIPKVLMTTGSISSKNYGSTGYANKAEKHHSQNALFIEVKGSKFWPTQLPWDGKGVQLFDRYYSPDSSKSKKAPKLEAVVYGDIHEDSLSKAERRSLMSLIIGLKSKKNVMHDLLDFHTGSHHKAANVLVNLRNPDFDIRGELDRALKFLDSVPNPVVVTSNHNDHLDQWFCSYDPRRAEQNIVLYGELMSLATQTKCGLFEAYATSKGVRAEYTSRNKKYSIKGNDLSQHGDKGPNGARGSAKGFARTGSKTIVGHAHSPMITKGCWQVGTSAMGMEYAQGYSSWLIAHVFVQASGKRTMIFVIQNKVSPMLQAALDRNSFA